MHDKYGTQVISPQGKLENRKEKLKDYPRPT